MSLRVLFTMAALVCCTAGALADEKTQTPAADSGSKEAIAGSMPTSHVVQEMEGWKVHVDSRLLDGPDKELGTKATKLLSSRLFLITLMVPADKVKRLQEVPFYLDLHCGRLKPAQYHPSAEWLKGNGFDPVMAKCVHIPDAAGFCRAAMQRDQPWAVLHELAHAYHDQVLSFENEEIKSAWQAFVDSGKYKSVLHMSGRMIPHYALTNEKEFFAEMTETYLGRNDFYPFNSAELRRDEPKLFALLKKIWGPLP